MVTTPIVVASVRPDDPQAARRPLQGRFEHPEHAAEFLRVVLPAALVDAIAWSTMKRVSGSFIDPNLDDRHSDLLFSVELHDGNLALIYLLLEHQSTVDPHMLLRLLDYLLHIWRHHLEQHPLPLPLTISLVISHAPGGWTAARSMHELFDPRPSSIPGLAPLIPEFTMLVEDLAHMTNEDLKARALSTFSKLVLWALRDARDADQLLDNLATGAEPSKKRRVHHAGWSRCACCCATSRWSPKISN